MNRRRFLHADYSRLSGLIPTEVIRVMLKADHGLPIAGLNAEKLEEVKVNEQRAKRSEAAHQRLLTAFEQSFHKLYPTYPNKQELGSSYRAVQRNLNIVGASFYSKMGYARWTPFGRWTAEKIEKSLLKDRTFLAPIFAVCKPTTYSEAHRMARRELLDLLRLFATNHSPKDLLVLAQSKVLDATLKGKLPGFLSMSLDDFILISTSGKSDLLPDTSSEVETVLSNYLLDFMSLWPTRPYFGNLILPSGLAESGVREYLSSTRSPEQYFFKQFNLGHEL